MPSPVVRVLLPTAVAAILLSQEFPSTSLDTDGTLFTVVIYGAGYSEAVRKIREWMSTWKIGPVLVTDGETSEDLLDDFGPRKHRRAPGRSPSRSPARPASTSSRVRG